MDHIKRLNGYSIYGRKAALHVHLDRRKDETPTLAIDAAFRLEAGTGGEYNWKDKLYLQLTHRELPLVCCVFLGLLPRCEFDQRGNSGKGLMIERQDSGLFFRVWSGPGMQYQVAAEASDLFHLSALGLKACSDLYGLDDTRTVVALQSCAKVAKT